MTQHKVRRLGLLTLAQTGLRLLVGSMIVFAMILALHHFSGLTQAQAAGPPDTGSSIDTHASSPAGGGDIGGAGSGQVHSSDITSDVNGNSIDIKDSSTSSASPGLGAWTVDITYNADVTSVVTCATPQGTTCQQISDGTVQITGATSPPALTSLATLTITDQGGATTSNCGLIYDPGSGGSGTFLLSGGDANAFTGYTATINGQPAAMHLTTTQIIGDGTATITATTPNGSTDSRDNLILLAGMIGIGAIVAAYGYYYQNSIWGAAAIVGRQLLEFSVFGTSVNGIGTSVKKRLRGMGRVALNSDVGRIVRKSWTWAYGLISTREDQALATTSAGA